MFDNIQDIIGFAVAKEQEAVDFYNELAQKVDNPAVADELRQMAAEEEKHRDRIREAPTSFLTGVEGPKIPDLRIADYTEGAPAAEGISFADAINIAMHREKIAMDFYNSLAGLATDPTARQLFANLAVEEARHKLYFETMWDEQVLTED